MSDLNTLQQTMAAAIRNRQQLDQAQSLVKNFW